MDRKQLEQLVREFLREKAGQPAVLRADLQSLSVSEADRLDTGNAADRVYTHDLFSLQQSPRLGAGLMEMHASTFPWLLNYDEIDYILDGCLHIITPAGTVTGRVGDVLLIPKGSRIQFSAPDFARFLYVTYPADWQS